MNSFNVFFMHKIIFICTIRLKNLCGNEFSKVENGRGL